MTKNTVIATCSKLLAFCVGIVILFLYIRASLVARQYREQPHLTDVISQLTHIKSELQHGRATEMQQLFPEGYFFSYVLYAYAWVNTGLTANDPTIKEQATTEALWVLQEIEQQHVWQQFCCQASLEKGVFYEGWVNRLRGGILLLQRQLHVSESALVRQNFIDQNTKIAAAFRQSERVFLTSYPDKAWPADNFPALLALKMQDELYGSDYRATVIEPWLTRLKSTTDEDGLIPHKVEYDLEGKITSARGSSMAYTLVFLPELDSQFAQQQYRFFNRFFKNNFLFVSLFREYKKGVAGAENIDSGPIVFGNAATATVVALGSAQANNDVPTATQLVFFNELAGLPVDHNGTKKYLQGKLLVYDCFLVWAKTVRPWQSAEETR